MELQSVIVMWYGEYLQPRNLCVAESVILHQLYHVVVQQTETESKLLRYITVLPRFLHLCHISNFKVIKKEIRKMQVYQPSVQNFD